MLHSIYTFMRVYSELFLKEKGSLATKLLAADLAGGEDSPKEINIHCPAVRVHWQNLLLNLVGLQ